MEHWVPCLSPSHGVTLTVLGVSPFLFVGPRCPRSNREQLLFKSVFPEKTERQLRTIFWTTTLAQRTIRKGDAAGPNARRASASLSGHRCHSEDGVDCLSGTSLSAHGTEVTLIQYIVNAWTPHVSTGHTADKRRELQGVSWRCLRRSGQDNPSLAGAVPRLEGHLVSQTLRMLNANTHPHHHHDNHKCPPRFLNLRDKG